jgi:hypothetical protein
VNLKRNHLEVKIMPIARKPQPKTIDEFINSGGTAPAELSPPAAVAPVEPVEPVESATPVKDAEKPVKLRVPESLLNQIDAAVEKRRPAPSRHSWILEAIWEKLEREEADKL